MTVATNYTPPSQKLTSTFSRVFLGENAVQRRAVKRLLLVSNAYLVIWLILGLSIAAGYSPRSVWLLIAYGMIGQIVFYILLRGGFTLHLKDPLLCFPQELYGTGSVVVGYAIVPFGQGPALQLLVLVLAFDLHRLTTRQIALVSSTAVALLAVCSAVKWHFHPEAVDLRQDALNIGMAVLVIPMLTAISGAVRRVYLNQVEQKIELNTVLGELKTLSQRDALTGAINRRYMMELLNDEQKRQRRTQRPFSLAMIDIDFFKRVNDTHGHAVGDIVLKQLAAIASQALREIDVIARWGGEEFLVLLPVSAVTDAVMIIENFRKLVEQHDWTQYAAGMQVTFSSGVAEHAPAASIEQTIEHADGALYRAKGHGRNCVEHA